MSAGKKILIVDDDKTASDELKAFLEGKGFTVFHELDGTKTLEALKEHKADLILLDIIMPGVDGFTIAKQIRYDEQTKNVGIIVFSAQEGMKELFAIEGITEYFVKPLDKEKLLETILKKLGQ